MKKYKIINNTNLNNENIGKIIDYIQKSWEYETIYYGKEETIRIEHNKRVFYIDIVYMKDFVKWYFKED